MTVETFAKVAEASKVLVEQGFSGPAVESAIGTVGRALGVQRALVYENSSTTVRGKQLSPLRHAWSDSALTPLMQAFPLADQKANWLEILSRGQPVWELVRNIQGPLLVNLEAQGVQSVVLCPINVGLINGRWWGVLRLDDCQKERRWSPEELSAVKTLARSLSNALRQDLRREELARTRHELQSMMDRCTGTR